MKKLICIACWLCLAVTKPAFAQLNYRLGVINFPKDDARTLQSLDIMQAGFVRWNVRWEEMEQTKGIYDFDALDAQLSSYYGRQILIMMATRNPLYCAPYCIGDARLNEYPAAGGLPDDLSAYQAFITAFVNRFGPHISFIEIDNEVNDYGAYWQDTILNYKQVLLAANAAVKNSSYPALPVVVAGFSSGQMNLLLQGDQFAVSMTEEILATHAFDFLDLHFYHRYQDIDAKINWLKSRGYTRLISTECSGPDLIQGAVTDFEGEKSVQLVKRFSILIQNALQKICWFSFVDLPKEQNRFRELGLVNQDFSRNPAFYTYKLFNQKVGAATSATRIDNGKYLFAVSGRPVLVLWSEGGPASYNARRYLTTRNVLVTHLITSSGQTDADAKTEIAQNNRIRIDSVPVFAEEVR